ncbi:uncharacterized protein MONOS_18550 [Monocercomonoides exilis]|uniref:uncharacterized protein n=1 Tax=Monocercomonoides exilis TaxID=2049356 RepID=UPI00355A2B3C|nr:hypothetical protein MONOS_18550 [Monocercomonoides exilis]
MKVRSKQVHFNLYLNYEQIFHSSQNAFVLNGARLECLKSLYSVNYNLYRKTTLSDDLDLSGRIASFFCICYLSIFILYT